MHNHSVPIRQVSYQGHIIEVSAVAIAEKWYPLFRILTHTFAQTHPWQVPAIDGVEYPTSALRTGTALGRTMIRHDIASQTAAHTAFLQSTNTTR
jgi:hypothetical protein